MELALAFIGLPVATYLVLASLQRGRPALYGVLAAVALTGVLFVTQMGADDSYMTALLMLVLSAIALAALVQVLRMAIGEGRPVWVYPTVVVAALLAAGLPLISTLGV